jgi:hypothetical protein
MILVLDCATRSKAYADLVCNVTKQAISRIAHKVYCCYYM